MTLPKFVAKSTYMLLHNGKRKTICAKGDIISVTKYESLTDKVQSYFEPVNAEEYEEYQNPSDKPQKSEQSAPDAERYKAMKKMMEEQENNAMQFLTRI